eukprot:CAMPEP_0172594524 /NCGR_PEP_ID=MMETSP1068-20121228/13943_1 /TAXON_ID=35684 /ORGANISM="Pseudopedinella elastica, Strain CCMP716" /LENGTH=1018 /DNA_ID=CAMNT_0013392609 /DNA_START=35 /DNA_END=3091 /DNA_ORIENTATION=+
MASVPAPRPHIPGISAAAAGSGRVDGVAFGAAEHATDGNNYATESQQQNRCRRFQTGRDRATVRVSGTAREESGACARGMGGGLQRSRAFNSTSLLLLASLAAAAAPLACAFSGGSSAPLARPFAFGRLAAGAEGSTEESALPPSPPSYSATSSPSSSSSWSFKESLSKRAKLLPDYGWSWSRFWRQQIAADAASGEPAEATRQEAIDGMVSDGMLSAVALAESSVDSEMRQSGGREPMGSDAPFAKGSQWAWPRWWTTEDADWPFQPRGVPAVAALTKVQAVSGDGGGKKSGTRGSSGGSRGIIEKLEPPKPLPVSPFRPPPNSPPPEPLWTKAATALQGVSAPPAGARGEFFRVPEASGASGRLKPPSRQAPKVIKNHEELTLIRVPQMAGVVEGSPRAVQKTKLSYLGEAYFDQLREVTFADSTEAGRLADTPADAVRWVNDANLTACARRILSGGGGGSGGVRSRRFGAVSAAAATYSSAKVDSQPPPQLVSPSDVTAALDNAFRFGMSTEEDSCAEKLAATLSRHLKNGRLTPKALADLIALGGPLDTRPLPLPPPPPPQQQQSGRGGWVRRLLPGLLGRGRRRSDRRSKGRERSSLSLGEARLVQVAGLRILRLLAQSKDPAALPALQRCPELVAVVQALEADAYALRAAHGGGKYAGFKPETYGAAELASLGAAALGVKPWRPKLPGQRGLRILCLDGGGTRGVLTVGVLQQMSRELGHEIHEVFDLVAGTSTGAIIAALIGVKGVGVDLCEEMYDELIPEIFQKNPIAGPIKLGMQQAYYDDSHWEGVLARLCGEQRMLDSQTVPGNPAVIAVATLMSIEPAKMFLARSLNHPLGHASRYVGSSALKLRHAIRMTSAAPSFFTPLTLDGGIYSDGALFANNPTAVAYYEAQKLFPGVPVELVVSIGSGCFVEKVADEDGKGGPEYGWGTIVNQLIESSTDTQRVHETLESFLPPEKYFRFNPRMVCIPIDETDVNALVEHKIVAREYFQDPDNKKRLQELANIVKKRSAV